MMECTRLVELLFGRTYPEQTPATDLETSGIIAKQPLRSSEDAASEFVDILRTAEKGGKDLERRLKNVVTANSWTESFAKLILSGVEGLVQHRDTIGQVVKEAMDKSADLAQEIFGFAKEHPVFVTIIAIGILVLIAPWVLEALGFGELGPIAETFASWWQARYAGFVPKGSLFSFFQRLGMTWS
ncbi:hypothetical protein CkaCkLH20_01690 [Colletotrichum karsti]|uniref:Uncharacterized protein n=1 Tax=Colletotrichum karsti TaxID=1095194 RepID=A0A9P6LP42_9PEZI|nr:uncharacterized protein CkaCkLH20_01690 [Colletotrichum karsti]KAF9880648.1 hypothetical protein CkaCkLH20_01690 [Colletotrichum karsti]